MTIAVRAVESRKERKEFIDFPWKIYRNYPNWVPPLKSEVAKMLTPGKYPFWAHAERELFLARKNGDVVGRIAAIIDRNHDQVHEEKAGFFGFFESVNDPETADELFEAARSWCRERGCSFLRGPASPSSNDEYGFLLEGFDKDPAIMMPYNPEYYLNLCEQCGFQKVKDLYAFIRPVNQGMPARIGAILERARKRSPFRLRPLDPRHFHRDVDIVKTVYNGAWERNWGFVPMTGEEMDFAAESMKPFFDPELIIIAELDGRPAGVGLTVPNVNEVLKKLNGKMTPLGLARFLWNRKRIRGIRSMVGGCLPEFRKSGLIAEIFYETAKRAAGRYEWCELGWNLEDNDLINSFDTEIGGRIHKKYRVYQMPL